MRILYKLIAGFMIVAALVGAVAYIGLSSSEAIGDSYHHVSEETIPAMDSLEKLKFYTSEITHLYTHVIMSENATHEEYELLKEKSGEFDRNLNKYEELVKKFFPDEMGSLEKIRSASGSFEKSSSELMELKRSGIPANGTNEYKEFNVAQKELLETINEALEKEHEEFNERTEHLDLVIASFRNSILLVSLITFILSVVIGSVISVSISRPMIRLKDAADEIRSGKLDTAVEIRSDDETGVLAGAFNEMVSDLAHEIKEHEQTAANLREKNDFVKTVLESLPYPFYVIDANDYTIKLANSAACIKGFADGTTCHALTHRSDKPCRREGHLCPLEEVKRTGKPALVEHLHYDKDGNVMNMEVHCYPIFDSFGNIVQVIEYSLDITDRKQAENALHESEERFRSVSQSASDAIIISDSDGIIIFWNNGAQKTLGYQSFEVIGKPLAMLMPQRYRDAHIKGLERIRITGASHVIGKSVELEALRKDGSEFPMELSLSTWKTGEKTFYSGILRDITERRRNEKALAESEEKFRNLFDNATDGILLAEVETKKQYMANKKICNMLGYGLEEILNLSAIDLHPEKDLPWIMEKFEKQARGEISLIENIPVKRKDGTVFYADINASPLNIGGKLYNLGIFRDITERRRNEEMRRENERLALANRAKSKFLMVMSHELRTPLNAIIGFSELLKKKDAGELNEKQQRYAENVHLSGKNLLRIIDDLLDLTRVESGKMEIIIEKVSVQKVINESVEIIKEKAAKQNVRIIKQLSTDIEFIETDGGKFRQMFNNLLGNAVKFSKPEGGTVTITAEKEMDMAKFSISDTGIGIKEEDMGSLFQNFEQLDSGIARKYGGAGLGLAISKKLVELLGGRITAESRYGKGSTFTFYLPMEVKNRG